MKTFIITLCCLTTFFVALVGCKKDSATATNTDALLEGKILVDFSANLANPNYQDIQAKAGIMKDAALMMVANTNDANLQATRIAWKNTRAAWESCEGFLFGPVEDFNYDPTMDDWPVNKVDLDSVLSSNNALSTNDIDQLATTLKGFHAIEYIIFGVGSTKKAIDITDREKVYLLSLTQSLYNTTTQLRNSWDPANPNNFTLEVNNAGNGSTRFTTRKAVFLALVGSMADICNEVADEKMQTPLAAQDSTLDESSFSHNSVTDFKNNITGVLHAYFGTYNGTNGHSISELVKSKQSSLDNIIKTKINTAIASFSGITQPYEQAIYTQKSQIKTAQDAIRALKTVLETNLTDFINTNIKD